MTPIFEQVYTNISRNKVAFFAALFLVSLVTYAILFALDFYPEPKLEENTQSEALTAITASEKTSESKANVESKTVESKKTIPVGDELPARIVIPKSNTDVIVLNPESLDMNDLDAALLDGVVRHPQSAHFTDEGNILIFGHSSYLPTVFNKNFQAFNGVQNLLWGDEVTLYSKDGIEYKYRVNRVYKVKASETIIDNARGKAKLTIVTCNSFGSKDDRFIVEALLVEETT